MYFILRNSACCPFEIDSQSSREREAPLWSRSQFSKQRLESVFKRRAQCAEEAPFQFLFPNMIFHADISPPPLQFLDIGKEERRNGPLAVEGVSAEKKKTTTLFYDEGYDLVPRKLCAPDERKKVFSFCLGGSEFLIAGSFLS